MKSIQKLLLLVLMTSASMCAHNSLVKIRAGAFIPTAERFRCIYGRAGGTVEVEVATQLYSCLQAWANFNWFSKCGKSIGFCNPTTIHIPNFSFGLNAPYEFCDRWTAFLGLGFSIAGVRIKNCSLCGTECICKAVPGLVVKSGLDFDISDCTFVEIFADYIYQPAKFQDCVNIGGLRVGAGLGFRF